MKIKRFAVVIIGVCGLSVGISQPVAGEMKQLAIGENSTKIEVFNQPLGKNALGMTEKARVAESRTSEFPTIVESKLANRIRVPRRTRGGVKSNGGSCAQNEKSFLALINPGNKSEKTLASHPNFWLYVPPSSGDITFNLVDNYSEEEIYQTKFNVESKGGFINFKLPSSEPPLEVAEDGIQTYSWIATLNCGKKELIVKGVVQRIPASDTLMSELESAKTVLEKIDIYEENDLWHETITELGNLRRSNPDDLEIKSRWNSVLEQYEDNLSAAGDAEQSSYNLTEEPIQDCCNLGDV